ncbi:MAG TPA: CarD family transcriptional regulator [Candidatus Acidoferrum sp.]|nr:CarD family transcriptional regulator [Candidatus Acidoferrum sp.]
MPSGFVSPFQPGELVVHATHGISRYVGTRVLQADDGSTAEYLELDYAEGDRIFVPVEHVGRLSKNIGQDIALSRLTASTERRTPYSRYPKPASPPEDPKNEKGA